MNAVKCPTNIKMINERKSNIPITITIYEMKIKIHGMNTILQLLPTLQKYTLLYYLYGLSTCIFVYLISRKSNYTMIDMKGKWG